MGSNLTLDFYTIYWQTVGYLGYHGTNWFCDFYWGGELFVSDYEIEGFVTIGRSALAGHRLREWHRKTICSSPKKKWRRRLGRKVGSTCPSSSWDNLGYGSCVPRCREGTLGPAGPTIQFVGPRGKWKHRTPWSKIFKNLKMVTGQHKPRARGCRCHKAQPCCSSPSPVCWWPEQVCRSGDSKSPTHPALLNMTLRITSHLARPRTAKTYRSVLRFLFCHFK